MMSGKLWGGPTGQDFVANLTGSQNFRSFPSLNGLNNLGQVVHSFPERLFIRSVLVEPDGTAITLDFPPETFVRDINDKGQTVGVVNGHGLIATPIPEPSTIMLFSFSLTVLLFLYSRPSAHYWGAGLDSWPPFVSS